MKERGDGKISREGMKDDRKVPQKKGLKKERHW